MADAGVRPIAWAGAVNLVAGATGSVIGLLLAAVVGRQLGADGAGTYFLVVALFMIVSNIAELGADTGLVRHLSAARATRRFADVPSLVSIAVRPVLAAGATAVAVTAVCVLVRPGLVSGAPAGLVVLAAALAVLSSVIAVMLSVARGLGDVLSYPVLQNIALPVLRLTAVAGVVVAGGSVAGVLTAWMVPVPVVLLAATIVALVRVRSVAARPGRPASDVRRLRRDFWTFSAARGASAAVEVLLEWLDVILVGALTSAEEAGIYAVVTRCARAGEVIQQAARIAVGPRISAALARGAVDEASEIHGLVTAAMIWLAWPAFIVLAVFPDVVLTAFGPDFATGAVSLSVLCLAMGVATAAGTVQTILLMGGRSTWQLADKSGALVLNIVLDLVLVPVWGIEGAAIAWAVTILVDTAVVVHQVHHLMGVRPSRHVGVAAALSVGAAGTIALASRLLLGSSVAVLVGTVGVVAVAHIALSIPLRHRLGLTALAGRRAGV